MGEKTDTGLRSWIHVPEKSDFPIQNLPFGIIHAPSLSFRAASRIGDTVIDLYNLALRGYFRGLNIDPAVFGKPYLNSFIAMGRPVWKAVRERLTDLFGSENPVLRDQLEEQNYILRPIGEVVMSLPIEVGDYTDFYSSIGHATNVGKMFRDPANALLPNWRHLPVGYHGRRSSIVISGTSVHRPMGQIKDDRSQLPEFGPTRQLDFELEMAFITGRGSKLGEPVPIGEAEEHIFGMLLFNDLSARDIQRWEYIPLGPFLGKSFGSVVSPWVVTIDALEPFRTEGPVQEPQVLPYLQISGKHNFDIELEVLIRPEGGEAYRVCLSNFRYMYWSMAQQLAHLTINGCNINVGDLNASGTISGPSPGSFGSMLELAWNGANPVRLPDGTERTFIHDHDTVIIRGYAEKDGVRIGFGEATTTILPARL